MDDAKIDQIARDVLTSLKKAHSQEAPAPRSAEPPKTSRHPALGLLSVAGGVVGTPCVIEPDKLCVGSLKCRSFGH